MSKAAEAFRTISEVASDLEVPKHVLRFWEAKFPHIRPMKRGGGRRYYRPEDMELLRGIRHLLHAEGYTIKGGQKILREHGVDHVKAYGAEVVKRAAENGSGKAGRKAAGKRPPVVGVRPSARSAAVSKQTAAPAAADIGTIIASAISELEKCRALLSGQAPAAAPRDEVRARSQRA